MWRADISKGGFDSEEKGGGTDTGILHGSTIKGVLIISLTAMFMGIVAARAHTSIAPACVAPRSATRFSHRDDAEDPSTAFVPRRLV